MSRKIFAALILWLQVFGLAIQTQAQERNETEPKPQSVEIKNKLIGEDDADDPDLPSGVRIDKGEYLRLRDEQIAKLRGIPYPKPDSRNQAIFQAMRQESANRAATGEPDAAPNVAWRPLGPAPIPVNATVTNSGRVSAIAVHPTNPNIAYVGTAQGGLYRTLDGGATWTPLMDNALSLAIGAVTISPSDPSIVFVGTGEATFSGSSFFGVGVYRITNADTNPVVAGPLNLGVTGNDVFTGRATGKIAVHPTNPNILFVTTTSGVAGIGGGATGFILPSAGLYRTSNALAASPVFEKLTVSVSGNVSRSMVDAVLEPGNPDRLVCTLVGNGGDGGVYLSTNAQAAVPTFTRTLTTGDGATAGRAELAINKVGSVVTVYAATGTANGTIFKSVDGGATFPTSTGNNFCNPQCFYDIAVDVDPTNADNVYLGGSPALVFGRSTNGGMSFANSSTGLHVDTQAIKVAPSNPQVIYFGSDGGIWKSTNGGTNWTSLNNSMFSATQFQSIALHPLDRHYTLGGTQDNGTGFLAVDGATWVRSDGGDGGFAAIDQNATNIANVTAYHTYFNASNSQIGFARATTGDPVTGDPNWSTFLGCGGTANGISCADSTLFYAPMVVGPGTPNTLYFGTNKLYRSADTGTTMTPVSQTLTSPASAIAISKQNDNVRLVGLAGGGVFATTTGSTTLTNVTGSIPTRYVGRIAIDPTNANTAYVALTTFGLPAGQHVWKTTNLLSGTPTWAPAGSGIPDVPTNALTIDPANTQQLFAGTDIGVFRSIDGGASWTSFSEGLPRVAVFGMEIQPTNRILKIATHGRGIWEMPLNASPTVRSRADFDGDGKTDFSVFRAGNWFVQKSTGGTIGVSWGLSGDQLVPGDYDGDGKTDYAIYRDTAVGGTNFFVINSATSTFRGANWGSPGDIAKAGDFDGDGKSDIAVYRPSTNSFYALPTSGGATISLQFGQAGDTPLVFDYDGDAKTDFAVFRPSTGAWFIQKSSNNTAVGIQFGQSGDLLVPADYDGDNKEDVAVFRAGNWYVLRSSNGQVASFAFGQSGDIPVPGDYDADGTDDYGVFRSGDWYIQRSSQGFTSINYGIAGDIPIPAAYLP